MEQELIEVGRIEKTKGFDGSMIVSFEYPIVEIPKAFFIKKGSQVIPILVGDSTIVSDYEAVIRWEKYDSKETAQGLNKSILYLMKSQFDTYFELDDEVDEILHYQVINNETTPLGEVIEVIETGNQITLSVGGEGYNELLIPLVDTYIEFIDDEAKVVYCTLSEDFIQMFTQK